MQTDPPSVEVLEKAFGPLMEVLLTDPAAFPATPEATKERFLS